jgi:hypothetical protein
MSPFPDFLSFQIFLIRCAINFNRAVGAQATEK